MNRRSAKPYNELGQILADGGEIALATAIALGYSEKHLSIFFEKRFRNLSGGDKRLLREHSERMVSGARAAEAMNATAYQMADLFPVNIHMYGDQNKGRRFKYSGDVQFAEGEERVAVRGDLPYFPSWDELRRIMLEQALRKALDSPGKFGFSGLETSDLIDVRQLSGEKAF